MLNLRIWTKPNAGMGSFCRSQHELVFAFKAGHGAHRNNVQLGRYGRNRTNVWAYAGGPGFGRAGEEGHLAALHPTVKPIAMVADAILDSSRRGAIVLDPFLGSGTRSVVVFRNNAIELATIQRSLAQQASMLEEKLAQERRLAQLQSNFVSMASHELRTPLTIIDGHAQRLAKMNGAARPLDIGQRSSKIRGAVRCMTSLLDSLLNSTRLIDGELYSIRRASTCVRCCTRFATYIGRSHRDRRSTRVSMHSLCRWKEIQSCCFK